MVFFELNVDVFVGNGTGTVACIISDMFSGTFSHIVYTPLKTRCYLPLLRSRLKIALS